MFGRRDVQRIRRFESLFHQFRRPARDFFGQRYCIVWVGKKRLNTPSPFPIGHGRNLHSNDFGRKKPPGAGIDSIEDQCHGLGLQPNPGLSLVVKRTVQTGHVQINPQRVASSTMRISSSVRP